MPKFLARSVFLVLLLSVAESWALPPCPGEYNRRTWGNCQSTHTWGDGEYVELPSSVVFPVQDNTIEDAKGVTW